MTVNVILIVIWGICFVINAALAIRNYNRGTRKAWALNALAAVLNLIIVFMYLFLIPPKPLPF